MTNVVIIGASGNIARRVTDLLLDRDDIQLTLFARKRARLGKKDFSRVKIVEGDALHYDGLRNAKAGKGFQYFCRVLAACAGKL